MTNEENRYLPDIDDMLQMLSDEIPPMPEGLHDRWMRQVEETPMGNRNDRTEKKTSTGTIKKITRVLAVAAAAVFVIGGTIASRDLLHPTVRSKSVSTVSDASASYESNDTLASAYMATYDFEESAAAYDYADESASFVGASAENRKSAVVESDRKIIRTVTLNVTAPDYAAAVESIRTACTEAGGRITSLNERNTKTATFVLRIPSENLDSFLEGAGTFGRITRRDENSEDVTESYQDTQARLNTQIALRERYTALLEQATTVEDMLEIENKLADVQYYIDTLTGSLRYTDNRVAESTVTITLKEEQPKEEVTNEEQTFLQRVAYAFTLGWEAFTGLIADMGLFIIMALPFIVLIVVVWIIIARLRKARRQRRG